MKLTVIPIVISAPGMITKGSVRSQEEMEIRGRAETIQTYSIVKVSQITEKNSGDLKRLTVSQTPVKGHQLKLVWKNSQGVPDIVIMVRVFANCPGDMGSIPGRAIPKTFKILLDASLLNTQHYKVRIKGKVEKSTERSSALPDTLL